MRTTRGPAAIASSRLLSVVKDSSEPVKEIEAFHGDINYADGIGWTALFHAAFDGKGAELCEALLKKGARIRVNAAGIVVINDALSLAIARRHIEICLVIIKNWPDDVNVPLTTKYKGQSYLHQAAAYGLPAVCQLLKERLGEEQLLTQDCNRKTPLEVARHHWENKAILAELEVILRPASVEADNATGTVGTPRSVGRTVSVGNSEGGSSHASARGGSTAGSIKAEGTPSVHSSSFQMPAVPSTTKRAREENENAETTAKKVKRTAKLPVGPNLSEGGGSSMDVSECGANLASAQQTEACSKNPVAINSVEVSDSDTEPSVAKRGLVTDLLKEIVTKTSSEGGNSGTVSLDAVSGTDTQTIAAAVKHKQVVVTYQSSSTGGGSSSGAVSVSVGENTMLVDDSRSADTQTIAAEKSIQVVETQPHSGSEGRSSGSGDNVDACRLEKTVAQNIRHSCESDLDKSTLGIDREPNSRNVGGSSTGGGNVERVACKLANAKLAIAQKRHAERTSEVDILTHTHRLHEEATKSCADRVAEAQKHVDNAMHAATHASEALLSDTHNAQLELTVLLTEEKLEVAQAMLVVVKKTLILCNNKLREVRDMSALAARMLEVALADVKAAEKQVRAAD